MIETNYINIHIENKTFRVDPSSKKESPHATMLKIQRIFEEKITSADTTLNHDKLFKQAKQIKEDFDRQVDQSWWITKKVFRLEKKQEELNSILIKIERSLNPASFFLSNEDSNQCMPKEMTQLICKYLPAKDLKNLAQVNKKGLEEAQHFEIKKAKEYGYKGDDLKQAQAFLKERFSEIHVAVKRKYIPAEFVVKNARQEVDAEATLRKLLHLTDSEKKRFLDQLNHFLIGAEFDLFFISIRKEPDLLGMKILLRLGADINFQDSNGNTALIFAAAYKKEKLVELLLEAGADPNIINNSGEVAIFCPLARLTNDYERSDKTIVSLLIEHGADIIHRQPGTGSCALFHACCYSSTEDLVNLMLQHAKDKSSIIDSRNSRGTPCLHLATMNGRTEAVKALLGHGANLEIQNSNGKTPLNIAIDERNALIMDLLLDRGANMYNIGYQGLTPVQYALNKLSTWPGGMDTFVKRGVDLNYAEPTSGNTNLMWAVDKGDEKIVKWLLDHHVDVNKTNAAKETAYHLALKKGKPSIVNLLKKAGGVIDPLLLEDGASLLNAVNAGDTKEVEILLKHGVNLKGLSPNGNTALGEAAKNGNSQIVKLLLDYGFAQKIDHENDQGSTALHLAAEGGHKECVILLLQKGAKRTKRNHADKTPLALAEQAHHQEVVQLLSSMNYLF